MKLIPKDKLEQGTFEWKKARLGKISGTRLKSVLGSATAQESLICELIAEEETEQPKEIQVNKAMERGVAEEEFAVRHYEEQTGTKTTEVGLCISDEFDWLIVSPDRLVIEKDVVRKGVEIKNPNSDVMMKYRARVQIKGKALPTEYKAQVLQYFLVIDTLEELDFVVYDARYIREGMKMLVVTVTRESLQKDIEDAKKKLIEFRKKWVSWKEALTESDF